MFALYEFAEQNDIEIFMGSLPNTLSMALPGYVALDYSLCGYHHLERSRTAHELGHCARNAFYSRNEPLYMKRRCENKADKWAIKKLIPKDELKRAVSQGITELWELANYFEVTEDLMKLAVWYYKYNNLAIEEIKGQ